MPRWRFLSGLLAALPACVDQPTDVATEARVESAVVGGTTARSGEWPDAVAVLGSSGTCTGTLIAPDLVLTAGHCANITPQQVIANTVDYSKDDGVVVHVAKTTAYPNWQAAYDVALLELASPITNV